MNEENFGLENYDYPNKNISREIIKKYFLKLKERGIIDNFKNLKVLMLSSWEGLDLQHIFFPLGFDPKNIIIVEIDKKVYEKMKQNPLFKNITIINQDIYKYKPKQKFDVFYLDFKGRQKIKDFTLLQDLIQINSHSKSVFYLNFLSGREFGKMIKIYDYIKGKYKENLTNLIENRKLCLTEFTNGLYSDKHDPHKNHLANKYWEEILNHYHKYRDIERLRREKPMILSKVPSLLDFIRKYEQYYFELEEFKELLEIVEKSKNYHIFRQDNIPIIIREILDLTIDNYKDFYKHQRCEFHSDIFEAFENKLKRDAYSDISFFDDKADSKIFQMDREKNIRAFIINLCINQIAIIRF